MSLPEEIKSEEKTKIIIIGAGVAGIALAIALKQHGIKSKIFEAYSFKEGIGAGFNIASNGMNVLKELGISEELKQLGTIAKYNHFRDHNGSTLARFEYGNPKEFGECSLNIKRDVLIKTLLKKAKEEEIEIEFEKRLVSIEETEFDITALFSDGSKETSDIIIGCDGHHSLVRKTLYPKGPHPVYVGVVGFGGFVNKKDFPLLSEEEEYQLNYTFGPNGFFGYGGWGKDEYGWWINYQSKNEFTKEELNDKDVDKIKKVILEQLKNYSDPVQKLIQNSSNFIKQNIYDLLSLPSWYKGRMCLIGDAAHTVSPNSGQGCSLALEDSLLLARILSQSKDDYEKSFKKLEELRKQRVETIVLEGRKRAKDKEIISDFQNFFRNTMMRIVVPLFGKKFVEPALSYKVPNEDFFK